MSICDNITNTSSVCIYFVEHGNKIDIDWTSFSLENANNCIYDSVITYEMGLNEAEGK